MNEKKILFLSQFHRPRHLPTRSADASDDKIIDLMPRSPSADMSPDKDLGQRFFDPKSEGGNNGTTLGSAVPPSQLPQPQNPIGYTKFSYKVLHFMKTNEEARSQVFISVQKHHSSNTTIIRSNKLMPPKQTVNLKQPCGLCHRLVERRFRYDICEPCHVDTLEGSDGDTTDGEEYSSTRPGDVDSDELHTDSEDSEEEKDSDDVCIIENGGDALPARKPSLKRESKEQ